MIVKEHDALPDVFKDARLEDVKHAVRGIIEAAPVEQKRRQAVAADGVVEQAVNALLGPEQEHGVDRDDHQYAGDHEAVLRTVLPRNPQQLADHQGHNRGDQRIGEHQMHPVQRLHLVFVDGEHRVLPDVMHRDLTERIDGEHDDLKDRVQRAQAEGEAPPPRELPLREVDGKDEQAQQHDVDVDEVDARHHRYAPVIVEQDADEVAEVHHRRTQTGIAQKAARRPVLAARQDSQYNIRRCDEDGFLDIYIQKRRIHAGVSLLPRTPVSALVSIYLLYTPKPRRNQHFVTDLSRFCPKNYI